MNSARIITVITNHIFSVIARKPRQHWVITKVTVITAKLNPTCARIRARLHTTFFKTPVIIVISVIKIAKLLFKRSFLKLQKKSGLKFNCNFCNWPLVGEKNA